MLCTSSKKLLFLSLYRSHVINEALCPGLMKTTAKITNSYWPGFVPVSCNYPLDLSGQCAKKDVSDSPGLVDFTIGLVNSVLNLPAQQLKFFKGF